VGVRGVSPEQEKEEEEGYGRERIAEKEAFKPAWKKWKAKTHEQRYFPCVLRRPNKFYFPVETCIIALRFNTVFIDWDYIFCKNVFKF